MTDRLVNGEPQVRRVDHEVVLARSDRWRFRFLVQQLWELGQFAGPVVAAVGHELPTASRRSAQRRKRRELSRYRVDGSGRELGLYAQALGR